MTDMTQGATSTPPAEVPDVDALFPAKQADVDSLFPPEVERQRARRSLGTSPIQDLIFGNTEVNPIARVLDHFGQGFKDAWGTEPLGISEENQEYLRKSGWFNDYKNGHASIGKAANEALMRPAAVALHAMLHPARDALEFSANTLAIASEAVIRGTSAVFSGAQEAVAQVGVEAEGTALDRAMQSDPDAGGGTRKLARDIAAIPEAFFGTPHPMGMPSLPKAKSLRVIGEGEAAWKGTVPPVEGKGAWDAYIEATKSDKSDVAVPEAGAAPATGQQLGTPAISVRVTTEAERAEHPAPDVNATARGIAPDLFYRYDNLAKRRETFSAQLEELRSGEVPEAVAPEKLPELTATVEKRLHETEKEIRELAPDVSEAYRAAREAAPEEAKPVPAEAARPEEASLQTETKPQRPIEEQRAAISNDVADKLIAVGRPETEARAAAAIEAAYWQTRAERFKGAKGSAEEMYRREAPEILGPGMQSDYRAARAKPTVERQTLGQFISHIGIKDNDPLISDVKSITGGRKFIRKDGVPLDRLREMAAEQGFISKDSTVRTLLDAMRSEDKGNKVFKVGEEEASKFDRGENLHHIEQALDEGLRGVGIDPKTVPDHVHSRAIEIMDKGERDPVVAYEKAEGEEGYFQRSPRNLVAEREAEGQMGLLGTERVSDAELAKRRVAEKLKPKAEQKPMDEGLFGTEKDQKELFQEGDIKRGRIRLREDGRNTITLLKDANASTFIHEKGHDYLARLMRDANDAQAPADLKTDAGTVLKWLGVEKPGDIKTSHHEKFARGFENYIMEGRAPSQALARVFEQFRQWLVRIYTEASRLKAPINDDIRGVFDRMLAVNPEKTVIASEIKPREAFDDRHAAHADTVVPERAHETAETVQIERDNIAARHIPEDHDARLAGIEAEARRRTAGSTELDRYGNAPGHAAGKGGIGEAAGAIGEGGGEVAAEGARPPLGNGKVEPPTTPHGQFPPAETALLDKAGNIRLDNLNTTEDINVVLRETAERNDNFTAARRGVISDAQVLDLADALGMDASVLSTRKLGEAFNAEQVVAARKLLVQSASAVRDAMAKAADGLDADVLAYAEAKSRHQMIQGHVSGLTAEAGRALRAFRALDGMKEATELGTFLEQSTGTTLYQLKREAQLGMSLDTPQKISKFVHDSQRATFKDMVLEFWINALLSGPLTHVKNILGNMLVAVNSATESGIAAGIGAVREVVSRDPVERVTFGEAKGRLFGVLQGAQDGVIAAKTAFKNEESFTGHTQQDQKKFQAIPGVAGKVVRTPGRFLTAEDEFFKAVAMRQELNALGHREATKLGLEGDAFLAKVADVVTNPTDEMMVAAKKAAEYQTFTNPLGATGRALQNFANSHVLAKVVVPFIRTPINLLKYASERTPIGLMSAEVRDNLAGRNGEIARDVQMSRLAMGSMIATATAGLALQDAITGGGPSDPKEKATLMLTGWRPYSVKVGEAYYAYDWLDPFSTIMGVVADLTEAAKTATSEDDVELSKVASGLVGSIAKNIMSKASLRGASDLVQAVTDPDRYGPKYIQNLAGTVVPAAVAQPARVMDPVQRETRTALDAIKARIPGLRQTLLPKRDIWGEPVISEGSLGPDLLSPIRQSSVSTDPVNQRLVDVGLWPSKLQRKIRGVDLTDQQYDDFARVAGRMAKMRLNAMVGQPGFSTLPDGMQKELMSSAINTSRDTARTLIMMQNPDIIRQAVEAKTEKLRP